MMDILLLGGVYLFIGLVMSAYLFIALPSHMLRPAAKTVTLMTLFWPFFLIRGMFE